MSNFNQAQYLDESLGGICNQTRPADRVIVVDDGSSDDSVQIIEKWKQENPGIILIRNKHNIGLQRSIERTLPLVKTDYMAWAASDDYLMPEFLEKSMAILKKYPDAGLCFSELSTFTNDRNIIQRFSQNVDIEHIYNLSDLPEYCTPQAVQQRMEKSYFPPSSNTVVVKVKCLKDVGNFIPELEWHSDWLAYHMVALRNGACVIDQTLALLRVRDNSYSSLGMKDRNKVKVLLNNMLNVLDQPRFTDIKLIFQKNPSFYSVWGRPILRLFMRRPRWWLTFVTYGFWIIKEYKKSKNASWAKVMFRSLAFLIRRVKWAMSGMIPRFIKYEHYLEAIAQRDKMSLEVSEWITKLERLSHKSEKLEEDIKGLELLSQQRAERISELERLYIHIEEQDAHIEEQDVHIEEQDVHIEEQDVHIEEQDVQIGELKKISKYRADRISELERLYIHIEGQDIRIEKQTDEIMKIGSALQKKDSQIKELQTHVLQNDKIIDSAGLINITAKNTDEKNLSNYPSILLNTMPKSGTYYIGELISRPLKLQKMILGKQYFPGDNIIWPRLNEFVQGGYITQDHLDASKFNLEMLRRYKQKIIIHVRDPRQATLSYVHFLNTDQFIKNKETTKLFIYPTMPDDFYDLTLEHQIDWGIAAWLPCLTQWTSDWLNAAKDNSDISFTSYEMMMNSQNDFVKQILDTFGIPIKDFSSKNIKKDEKIHFREGKIDEWKSVFTEEQISRANGLISEDLVSNFDWQV